MHELPYCLSQNYYAIMIINKWILLLSGYCAIMYMHHKTVLTMTTYISIRCNSLSSICHDSKSLESKHTELSCTYTRLKTHIITSILIKSSHTFIRPVSRICRSSQITQNSFKDRILFSIYCIHYKGCEMLTLISYSNQLANLSKESIFKWGSLLISLHYAHKYIVHFMIFWAISQ